MAVPKHRIFCKTLEPGNLGELSTSGLGKLSVSALGDRSYSSSLKSLPHIGFYKAHDKKPGA